MSVPGRSVRGPLPSPGNPPRPAGRGDGWILGAVLVVAVGCLFLIALAAQPEGSARSERTGSTHVSAPEGSKAIYSYLERAGLEPSRVRTADLAVPPGAALVLIEVDLAPAEADALVGRVESGLTLFVASSLPEHPLWERMDLRISPDGVPGRAIAAWPSPAVRGVERVEVSTGLRALLGGGSGAGWVEILADDAGAIAVSRRFGAGEVIALVDPSILLNSGLAKAHNLRFADSALRHLAGSSGRVVFDEYHHGYGFERTVTSWLEGMGMLPAFWLAGIAIVLHGLSRNRNRIGPPRPPPEPERRAVREFIASYAGLLRASGHRGYAVRALERTLRRRLLENYGIPLSTPPVAVFKRLTTRAPKAAARTYRALERAGELSSPGAAIRDQDLLDLARDVRGAEAFLGREHGVGSQT